MAKGYIIGSITATNPEAYARYVKAAGEAFANYGGKALVRGGRCEALEGNIRPRNVVLEFDSYEAAHAYYHSPEYTAARALRKDAAEASLVLVEGV